MRAHKRVEVGTTATSKRSYGRKPRLRRAFEQVMTNCEHTRVVTIPNRPVFFISMRPFSVWKPPRKVMPNSTSPAASANNLAKATLPCAASKAARQSVVCQRDIAMHADRSKKISTDNRSAELERVIQSAIVRSRSHASHATGGYGHHAALAIGHADLLRMSATMPPSRANHWSAADPDAPSANTIALS